MHHLSSISLSILMLIHNTDNPMDLLPLNIRLFMLIRLKLRSIASPFSQLDRFSLQQLSKLLMLPSQFQTNVLSILSKQSFTILPLKLLLPFEAPFPHKSALILSFMHQPNSSQQSSLKQFQSNQF